MQQENQKDNIPDSNNHNQVHTRYQIALRTAVVAAVFCVIVCVLLLLNHFRTHFTGPLESQELMGLKQKLLSNPEDESLIEQIRSLDVRLRQEYFRRQHYSLWGKYLLLGGLIVFLISGKLAAVYKKQPPHPSGPTSDNLRSERIFHLAFRAVLVLTVLIAIVSVLSILITNYPCPPSEDVVTKEQIVTDIWPRFRGPGGLGISTFAKIPTQWDGNTGQNIRWKSPIPLPGNNSPIIWSDKIFLIGANKVKREVYCYHALSGKMLWQKTIPKFPGSPAESPDVMEDTGYAASTAATDGQNVYAIFPNGDVVALNFQGELVWAKSLSMPDSMYGFATSLLTYQDLLLVKFDQATDEDDLSKLLALEGKTGAIRWQVKRPVGASWSTPVIIHADNPDQAQLITCAAPWVISYKPATGAEIWRADCLYGDVAPSPVFGDPCNLVYVIRPSEELIALRTSGSGDVTKTNIVWRGDEGIPDISSPLCTGDLVLVVSGCLITCYHSSDGKQLWQKELDLDFKASPSLVGENIYLVSEKGVTVIIKAASEYSQINQCPLGEKVHASPAFATGRIYLRGENNLYCIGQ